jgi:hypothetical protein
MWGHNDGVDWCDDVSKATAWMDIHSGRPASEGTVPTSVTLCPRVQLSPGHLNGHLRNKEPRRL